MYIVELPALRHRFLSVHFDLSLGVKDHPLLTPAPHEVEAWLWSDHDNRLSNKARGVMLFVGSTSRPG
jgi:hypothetical protein